MSQGEYCDDCQQLIPCPCDKLMDPPTKPPKLREDPSLNRLGASLESGAAAAALGATPHTIVSATPQSLAAVRNTLSTGLWAGDMVVTEDGDVTLIGDINTVGGKCDCCVWDNSPVVKVIRNSWIIWRAESTDGLLEGTPQYSEDVILNHLKREHKCSDSCVGEHDSADQHHRWLHVAARSSPDDIEPPTPDILQDKVQDALDALNDVANRHHPCTITELITEVAERVGYRPRPKVNISDVIEFLTDVSHDVLQDAFNLLPSTERMRWTQILRGDFRSPN